MNFLKYILILDQTISFSAPGHKREKSGKKNSREKYAKDREREDCDNNNQEKRGNHGKKIKIYKKEKINVYHASISLYNDVVIYDDL